MASWEEYAPLAVAGGVLAVGVVWAIRSRPETRTEAVIAQPQQVDVGAIVGAQASLAQARLAAGTQLASEYMQTLLGLEQSKLQAKLAEKQLETQERIAAIQAEAAKAQIAAQLEAARAQAAAQQQSSFWNFLGGVVTAIIPFLPSLFSRRRTEIARRAMLSYSRPLRAQLEATAVLSAMSRGAA